MRCFIAIDVENFFSDILNEMKKISGIRVVRPENLHITLKFLGEIQESMADKIYRSMQEALTGFESFEIDFRGVGVFPSKRYIRVIWIGIDKNKEKLMEIQKSIDQKLFEDFNFEKEDKFIPHLTVARVKFARERQKIIKLISKFENIKFGEFLVKKVRLKKSKLTPQGPIYETVGETCL